MTTAEMFRIDLEKALRIKRLDVALPLEPQIFVRRVADWHYRVVCGLHQTDYVTSEAELNAWLEQGINYAAILEAQADGVLQKLDSSRSGTDRP